MHECRSDEHASAKVSTDEERMVWNGQLGVAAHNQRERTGERRESENEEEGEDV